jgi:hypothetical protein
MVVAPKDGLSLGRLPELVQPGDLLKYSVGLAGHEVCEALSVSP